MNWSHIDHDLEVKLRRQDQAIYWGSLCGIIDNYQTRTLLGTSLGPAPFGTLGLGREQTMRAIDTMLNFAVVLVLEQVLGDDDEMQTQLRDVLGWEHTSMPKENAAHSSSVIFRYDDLSPKELAILQAHNQEDKRLYEAALAMQSLVHYDRLLSRFAFAR